HEPTKIWNAERSVGIMRGRNRGRLRHPSLDYPDWSTKNALPTPARGPVTLGKNFRLPTDVRPKSYDADLRLDLPAGRFEGRLVIALTLGAARDRLHLHGVGLDMLTAEIELAGGRRLPGQPSADADSQTITLAFAESLPAGPA